jgi:PAS domain S-box-containing protein
VTDAAHVVVRRLVRTFDVRAASIWVVEPSRPTLRHVAAACSGPEALAWQHVCEQTTFRRGIDWVVGVGAPGVAWGTAAPCQKTDFWEPDQNGASSRRASAAREAGIRTVCAVPVLAADGVNAVIEIGGSHNYPGFERLPALVEHVAQQFGAFVVQRRNQAAYEELFQRSPDALLVVNDDEEVVRANARARALFGDPESRSLRELFKAPFAKSTASLDDAADVVAASGVFGLREDGSEFPVEVSISETQVHGAAGTIVALRDLTERRRTEAALRRSLHEKTTLVQEVHHRVKNNLQVISSLVSLQCARVSSTEVQAALLDTSRRIQSVALVHQQLYASDNLAKIDLLDYLRALSSSLQGSLGPDVQLHVAGDSVSVTVEQASPVGLVINELLLNSAKHGRSSNGECRVGIELECRGRQICIRVRDEGPGFDSSRVESGSMGQTLIRALCRQLRAEIDYAATDGASGTSVRLTFAHSGVT